MEPEGKYRTAMGAVKNYTEMLEKAVVLHDLPNANLYAQALAELVMTGHVNKPLSQPEYNRVNLLEIKAQKYGIGSRKANKDEKETIYRALDALAIVPTLQAWWSRNRLPKGENFNVSEFINPGEENEPYYAHRLAISKYFKEQITKTLNFSPFIRYKNFSVSGSSSLSRLFQSTSLWSNLMPALIEYISGEYKASTYKGVVSMSFPDLLEGFTSASLKQLYPWIKTIDFSRVTAVPKIKGFTFFLVDEPNPPATVDEGKTSSDGWWEMWKAYVKAWDYFDSVVRSIMNDYDIPLEFQGMIFRKPLKTLFELEDGTLLKHRGSDEPLTKNVTLYGCLFDSTINALSPEEKEKFREHFERKLEFGQLTDGQRSLVLQMLNGKRLEDDPNAFRK